MFEYTVCTEFKGNCEEGRDVGCSKATRPFHFGLPARAQPLKYLQIHGGLVLNES